MVLCFSQFRVKIRFRELILGREISECAGILLFPFVHVHFQVRTFRRDYRVVFLLLLSIYLYVLCRASGRVHVRVPQVYVAGAAGRPVEGRVLEDDHRNFQRCERYFCWVVVRIIIGLVNGVYVVVSCRATVSQAFHPCSHFDVGTVIYGANWAPLASSKAIWCVVGVMFASFAIYMFLVVFRRRSRVRGVSYLRRVPIIVESAINCSVVHPFLRHPNVSYRLIKVVNFRVIM